MSALRRAVAALVLLPLLLMPAGAGAGHDGTWHPNGGSVGSGNYRPQFYIRVTDVTQTSLRIDVVVDLGDVEDDPGIGVRGVARIHDDTSTVVLIAEPTGSTASCRTEMDSGDVWLTGLNLLFRDARGNTAIGTTLVPPAAPLGPGAFEVMINIGDRTWAGEMTIRPIGPGGQGPVERGGR